MLEQGLCHRDLRAPVLVPCGAHSPPLAHSHRPFTQLGVAGVPAQSTSEQHCSQLLLQHTGVGVPAQSDCTQH